MNVGGKMPTLEWQLDEPATKTCKALKNYDEAKDEHRIQRLKYLVLVNMVMYYDCHVLDPTKQ